MMRVARFLLLPLLLLLLTAGRLPAQILQPAKWSYSTSKPEVKAGEELDLIFSVKIDPDWYLYSTDFDPNLGPMVTEFKFKPDASYQLVGGIKPVNPKKKFDDIWGGEYTYFTKTAEFRQKVKVLQPNPVIKGTYTYQVCTDADGKCIPFDEDFSFSGIKVTGEAAPGKPTGSNTVPTKDKAAAQTKSAPPFPEIQPVTGIVPAPAASDKTISADTGQLATVSSADSDQQPAAVTAARTRESRVVETKPLDPDAEGTGLLAFMLIAFGSGLIALLTPCVFPMIPMTVSYFTSGSGSRAQGILKALLYGFSIVFIYTVAGTLVAKLAGPDAANFLSTHWLPNVFFFVIFVLFGLSFLGMFDITLPNWLVNKVDQQADKGGMYGIVFMAFTLVLVSFSCTGPIVGSLLVESARGETLKPVAGMFAFGMAFALPFTLFAVFPGLLSGLPRSGGWLNSVKVVLGFLELALSLKFLSIADQVYHWHLLDREIYLALWIITFTLMGLYLLGKIRLPHDSEMNHVSVPRLVFSLLTLAFVVYLVPGMFGAPLRALSGYLPPQTSQDFDLERLIGQGSGKEAGYSASGTHLTAACEPPKYADFLHLPHSLKGYFNLDQALACARKVNKPVFIDFTGHGCVNCREMEANVWSNPEVLQRLREDFVVVALYVDDKTELPQSDWYTSEYDGKEKTTIGRQNADYQVRKFNVNAQPYYVLMGLNGEPLVQPQAYNLNVRNFVDFLESGKEAFRKGASLSVAATR